MARVRPDKNEWLKRRRLMVEQQLRQRGVRDERVLQAMLAIPREHFVPLRHRALAYEDRALGIDHNQTISQPFIVAYMTEQLALTPEATVLEVGTGTGYQTAVLSSLCRHVHTIERIEALHHQAARHLAELDIVNVTLAVGDGSKGLAEFAPYDRVLVTAAAPRIPAPLVSQLVDGGRLVMPVGGEAEQTIVAIDRRGSRTMETPRLACRFVKLIGAEGWRGDHQRPKQ